MPPVRWRASRCANPYDRHEPSHGLRATELAPVGPLLNPRRAVADDSCARFGAKAQAALRGAKTRSTLCASSGTRSVRLRTADGAERLEDSRKPFIKCGLLLHGWAASFLGAPGAGGAL